MVLVAGLHLLTGDINLDTFLASPDLVLLLSGLGLGSVRAAIAKV